MGGILSLYNEEARPGESNRESSGRGADARPLQTAPTCSGDEAEEPGQGGGPGTTLDDLPEACLARILAHVDRPRDVARLALVSRSFGDAVRSDTVWEKLLPRNYAQVLAEAADAQGPVSFSSKKEIYDFLCRNVVFLEGGKKVSGSCPLMHVEPRKAIESGRSTIKSFVLRVLRISGFELAKVLQSNNRLTDLLEFLMI